MPIIAENKTVERELVGEGTHLAICYSMIELGTKEETFSDPSKGDIVKRMHKARLEWELCNESFTYEKDGEEFTGLARIGKDYTLSMNEKSNLRKDLQSWRGKAFTEDEAKSFDITVLLGVPCLIGIVHAISAKGKKYAKISSISTLMKGQEKPTQHNDSFLFELDNYSDEKLEMVPEWIQDQIKESDEYKALKTEGNPLKNVEEMQEAELSEGDRDSAPFPEEPPF